MLNTYLAIAAGGAVGACARYAMVSAVSRSFPAAFPVGTLAVNIAGGLLAGVVMVLLTEKQLIPETLRPLLLVGLLGGFTTFSAFTLEVVQLMSAARYGDAILYVLLSVVLCVLACMAGMFLARFF